MVEKGGNMKYGTRIISCVLLLMLLGACAVVPIAPMEQDAEAKTFTASPGMASLYIYRNEVIGAAIPMSVSVNGRMLGQTGSQSYFWLNVRPGKYAIESHAENVSRLSVNVESGKIYYVWQEVKMGFWMARSLLQQVDESTGRAGVKESQLITSSVSENDILPLDATNETPSAQQAPPGDSAAQRLRELENLRKEEIITDEEYQKKRQQLLEKL